MAFRIHESVVRGEIDNRVKGIVRSKIWVCGRDEPVVLDLKGNAWLDLAGCRCNWLPRRARNCSKFAGGILKLMDEFRGRN